MRIALDTNVLVAGLLSPFGPPARVQQLLLTGKTRLCCDTRIFSEYRLVLARPKFSFASNRVDDVLQVLADNAEMLVAEPAGLKLPDPDDVAFLEVAITGMVNHLVTGNLKHFPARHRRGVSVINPAQFVDLYRSK